MLTIESKKSNLNIITFGSCLSRFTVNQFINLYGGKLLSAVYNNRSDNFTSIYLDKTTTLVEFKDLSSLVTLTDGQQLIFKRQTLDEIGIYNNKTKNLFDVIKNQSADLIIFDNFMDLTAKVVSLQYPNKTLSNPFFLTKAKKGQDNLIIQDYLPISNSISNFNKIINYFKSFYPKAKLVFLCFPTEGYALDHIIHQRRDDFNAKFFDKNLDLIINCHVLSKANLTEEKQHFKAPFYASLASTIYSTLLI